MRIRGHRIKTVSGKTFCHLGFKPGSVKCIKLTVAPSGEGYFFAVFNFKGDESTKFILFVTFKRKVFILLHYNLIY